MNPFQKKASERPPEEQKDEVRGSGIEGTLPAGMKDVCPVMGVTSTPVPKSGQLVRPGQMPEFEIQMNYPFCIKAACSWWDGELNQCGEVTKRQLAQENAALLERIADGLAPLQRMFGK